MFGVHPHGIHCWPLNAFALLGSPFDRRFPGLVGARLSGLAATVIFQIPVVRELFLSLGYLDAGRATADCSPRAACSLTCARAARRRACARRAASTSSCSRAQGLRAARARARREPRARVRRGRERRTRRHGSRGSARAWRSRRRPASRSPSSTAARSRRCRTASRSSCSSASRSRRRRPRRARQARRRRQLRPLPRQVSRRAHGAARCCRMKDRAWSCADVRAGWGRRRARATTRGGIGEAQNPTARLIGVSATCGRRVAVREVWPEF